MGKQIFKTLYTRIHLWAKHFSTGLKVLYSTTSKPVEVYRNGTTTLKEKKSYSEERVHLIRPFIKEKKASIPQNKMKKKCF